MVADSRGRGRVGRKRWIGIRWGAVVGVRGEEGSRMRKTDRYVKGSLHFLFLVSFLHCYCYCLRLINRSKSDRGGCIFVTRILVCSFNCLFWSLLVSLTATSAPDSYIRLRVLALKHSGSYTPHLNLFASDFPISTPICIYTDNRAELTDPPLFPN